MSQPKRLTRVAPADPQAIAEAAACLNAGGLVAMPTETVYGLAADATNDRAVAAIYAAKGRPRFNPLIAHVAGAAAAAREGAFDDFARRLAEAFWPGPLTIVAPVAPTCQVSLLARAGLETVALRAPDHPTAQALIAAAGVPLAAPSANRSGRVSPTTAAHVAADLDGRIDWILDGGPARRGVESTIVACLGGRPRLLRPGALTRERIEAALGVALDEAAPGGAPIAPGQLASHYAPRARLQAWRARTRRRRGGARFRRRAGAFGRDGAARPFALRRPRRGRRPPLCISARARRQRGGARSPSRRSPSAGSASPLTTGFAAPRRRAEATPDAATSCRGGCGIRFLAHSACASAYGPRFRLPTKAPLHPWPPHSTGMNSV